MKTSDLEHTTKGYLVGIYPDIEVKIRPASNNPDHLEFYFTEKKFALLYPMQRYHYLINAIPGDFVKKHMASATWYELAPGEKPNDLHYPDDELIKSITPDVMKVLFKVGFFEALDEAMAPIDTTQKGESCWGDFRITQRILKEKGFAQTPHNDEIFDICHVLMAQNGYCDCEVLFNIYQKSRLKTRYVEKRNLESGNHKQHKE